VGSGLLSNALAYFQCQWRR